MSDLHEAYTFGRWVRAWRTKRGLSVKGAAQLAGWQPSFWSNLEQERRPRKGGLPPKPDQQTVEAVSNVLNLPAHVALLAAGHAPPDWQAQLCSMMPEQGGEGNGDPSMFSNVLLMCPKCQNSERLEYGSPILTIVNGYNKNERHTDTKDENNRGGALQRLEELESNVEQIVLALGGTEEIKRLANAIRQRSA